LKTNRVEFSTRFVTNLQETVSRLPPSQQFGDGTCDDAPQREVLPAIDQHPIVDGIHEEVGTETHQEHHNDARNRRANHCSTDATGAITNDSSCTNLKEACEGKRNNDRWEHSGSQDNRNGRCDH